MPRYLRPNQFLYPQPLETLYGNQKPLHLEVGFGDGRFWAQQHKQDGDVNYLGVEVSGVSLQKAFARYKALGLEDAVLTRISAEFLIRNCLPKGSISRIYLNFPDPWFKEKHSDNRFVRTETFELLSGRLVQGGELWLTTDHPPYMEYALEQVNNTKLYSVQQTSPPPAALQTKYAMRWQSQGLNIHHARFKLQAVSSQDHQRIEVFQGEPMPHSQLSGDIPQNPLEKTVARFPDCTVILLESYIRSDSQIILARVEEPDYAQEILIAVGKNPEGRVTAKLESFGQPLITAGVKKAVGTATDWLERQGMTVMRRAY
jgi:tRNA (guanine-N7-)-methyltransferase